MKICYIARHRQSMSNDDEGAITYVLRRLGHEVMEVGEQSGKYALRTPYDLVLFHKFCDIKILKQLRGKSQRVFWYFDLVDYPDATIANRCKVRKDWMEAVIPHVDYGFCTDGDWINSCQTSGHPLEEFGGKLHFLSQGFDERRTIYPYIRDANTILFTGINQGGGVEREQFVNDMKQWYGNRFYHVRRGAYGKVMAKMVNESRYVVCPYGPVTNHYWSNRVYNAMGLGGLVLHPFSKELSKEFKDKEDILYYNDSQHLWKLIQEYDQKSYDERRAIANRGQAKVLQHFTYRHRVKQLLNTVFPNHS